jgi:hypothetical protein
MNIYQKKMDNKEYIKQINGIIKNIHNLKKECKIKYSTTIVIKMADELIRSHEINDILKEGIMCFKDICIKPDLYCKIDYRHFKINFKQVPISSTLMERQYSCEKKVENTFDELFKAIILFLRQEEFELYTFKKLKEFCKKDK